MRPASSPPRRVPPAARPRVALLLLGLIFCALLILRQRVQVSGEANTLRQATEHDPTAQIDPKGGPKHQGEFELLDVTREKGNAFFPPTGTRIFPAYSLTTPGGTGIWVQAKAGIGVRLIPLLPDEHRFQVGAYWLVTKIPPGFDFSSPVGEWRMADGMTPVPAGKEPYAIALVRQQSTLPTEGRNAMLLVPPGLRERFRITARPLSRDLMPLGPPVDLVWQPAGEDALFVQIPVGYSAQTRGFEIAVARRDAPKQKTARWRIQNLPPAAPPLDPKPRILMQPQTIGRLAISASAQESEDRWSAGGLWDHVLPITRLDPPVNIDGHGWSGVPTVRCRLAVESLPGTAADERWEMLVKDASPQWNAPPEARNINNVFNRVGPRPTFVTLRPADVSDPLVGTGTQELTCGVAYPGQQRYVRLSADIVRYATRVEPLVFHDAEIVEDSAASGGRLVWKQPQTLVTPSGMIVTVLNARRPSTLTLADEFPDSSTINNSWFYRRLRPGGQIAPGSVELRLAWLAPTRLTTPPPPKARERQYQPWRLGVGENWKTVGGPQPARWTAMWMPGAPPPGLLIAPPAAPVGLGTALGRAGIGLRAAHRPDALTPLLHQNYVPIALRISPSVSKTRPRHLDSLTVLVRTRIEMERQSVILTVPLAPSSNASKTTFEASAQREKEVK